jgi:hypothetical protein
MGMSENLASKVIRPTYEQLRDRIPDPGVREMWRAGNADASRARAEMQRIHEDETLSEEGKKAAAQRVIDQHAARAKQHYHDARAKAELSAESAYEFSIPLPDRQCYATSRAKDSGELLAIQGEANRISEKVSGMTLQTLTKAVSKNPRDEGIKGGVTSARADILRAEYADGMKRGGLEGKVKAHAVLRVADASSIETDAIVDEFRNDRQRRYVQESAQIDALRNSIPSGKDLARNPYDGNGRGGKKRIGTYGGANKALMTGGRPQLFQKKSRRRPWK